LKSSMGESSSGVRIPLPPPYFAGQLIGQMGDYLYPEGAVYIFENTEAKRVKIGITFVGTSYIEGRLRAVNDMWLGRKVTCQICGGRLLNIMGLVPQHVGSERLPSIKAYVPIRISGGRHCWGGNALPLEKDVALAESYRDIIMNRLGQFTGSEKISAIRITNTLKKRIEKFRQYCRQAGTWVFKAVYYTGDVAQVEFLAHKILADHQDKQAPIGEVFCCSVSEATEVVETALSHLGLLDSARKRTQL
jgi:hypothetical protein